MIYFGRFAGLGGEKTKGGEMSSASIAVLPIAGQTTKTHHPAVVMDGRVPLYCHNCGGVHDCYFRHRNGPHDVYLCTNCTMVVLAPAARR